LFFWYTGFAAGFLEAYANATGHWVDTWTSMPQLTEPANLPLPPFVCVH
jgi:hypothetical protein